MRPRATRHEPRLRVLAHADVPAQLRGLADAIERGHHGTLDDAVLVLSGRQLEVLNLLRPMDGAGAHLILGAASLKLVHGVLVGKGSAQG